MKYAALVKAIHSASVHSQGRAALAVNQALVLRNWLVGAWIFEFEQSGKDRAKYGDRLLETLAADLQKKEVKGLNVRALDRSRLLYRTYPILASAIPATLSPEFLGLAHSGDTVPRIPVTLSPESAAITSPSTNQLSPQIRQTVSAESPTPLTPETLLRLSWSHLQELIAIDDPWKRAFFENECLLANWSVRQLRRQIGSPSTTRYTNRSRGAQPFTRPLPRSRPRTHRKPDAATQAPQTSPAQAEILSPHHMATISNHRVGRSPLREHSAKTVSEDAWQHDRIELLPLNPDYDHIPVAPDEGPEMVVVGEWLASID